MELRILGYHEDGYVTVEATGEVSATMELGPFAAPLDEEEREELRSDPERVLAYRFLQRGEVLGQIAIKIGMTRDEVGEAVSRYLDRLG